MENDACMVLRASPTIALPPFSHAGGDPLGRMRWPVFVAGAGCVPLAVSCFAGFRKLRARGFLFLLHSR